MFASNSHTGDRQPETQKPSRQRLPQERLEVCLMYSRHESARTERLNGTAEEFDGVAASRTVYYRCPFCSGTMVGRTSEPGNASNETLACTSCSTVINFTREFRASA